MERAEIWVDVIDYENLYSISNYGKVLNKAKSKLLTPTIDKDGYYKITLCKNNIRQDFRRGRLVALHFVPNLDNKKEVNHLDNIRSNDFYLNLNWVTRSENMLHGFESKSISYKHGNAPAAILTMEIVKKIRDLFATGKYTKAAIARKFKIGNSHVNRIISRKIWNYKNI